MMQPWFEEAKLGIFIHWGIYAVQRRGGESWPFVRGEVSYDEYMTQFDGFTAKDYDPEAWAALIKRSGARYAVLTTKHHDGVALWPTQEEGPSIPARGHCDDLVGPYVEAIRNAGLHCGLYFSHTDWSQPEHFEIITQLSREDLEAAHQVKHNYIENWRRVDTEFAPGPDYEARWQRFLDFRQNQLRELLTEYGNIDLLWFDVMIGSHLHDYKSRELRDFIRELSPDTVINSRLEDYGDYETPEQFIPVQAPDGPWEFCVTTNNTWSYTGREEQYKSAFELLHMFCECLGMGGNMLLNIGPDEHGVIPPAQVQLLEEIGDWIQRNHEAVYGTRRGLPHGYAYGPSSFNEAGDVIYLYLSHLPRECTTVKGIHNQVKRVSLVHNGMECTQRRVGGADWIGVPGTLHIDLPTQDLDPQVTVLKIELEGPLDLYSGEGVEINVN